MYIPGCSARSERRCRRAANGAPHPDASSYAKKFAGKYAHRTVKGGVGHNLPQEALTPLLRQSLQSPKFDRR